MEDALDFEDDILDLEDNTLSLEGTLELEDTLGFEDDVVNLEADAVYSGVYIPDMEGDYWKRGNKNSIFLISNQISEEAWISSTGKISINLASMNKANIISRRTSPMETDKEYNTCCLLHSPWVFRTGRGEYS